MARYHKPPPCDRAALRYKADWSEQSGGGSASGGLCDSLGLLATFVGCCLFVRLPLTGTEVNALQVK